MQRQRWLFALGPLFLALPAVGQPAVAQPAPMVALTMELAYRERIALPPGSTAEVVLVVEGREVARLARPTEGHQPPIGMRLDAPAPAAETSGELRAALRFPDGAAWTGIRAVTMPPGQAELSLGVITLRRQVAEAAHFACGAEHVVATPAAGGITLLRRGEEISLRQVPAASGARYEGEGPGAPWSFHERGGNALLGLGGTQFPECERLDGPPVPRYRAQGHEPSWVLDIAGDAARLRLGFEGQEMAARLGPARAQEGLRLRESPPGEPALRVEFRPGPCADTMADMTFAEHVRVVTPDATLAGCGSTPEARLTGDPWTIERIGDMEAQGHRPVTLRFEGDGREGGAVGGQGPCNTYRGEWSMLDGTLRLSPLASTMMACGDAEMAQERTLFDILAGRVAHRFTEDGALVIEGPGGSLLARR